MEKKENCYLRNATPDDVDMLYEWVNDPVARQSAFDSHRITYKEHCKWFDCMMNDPDQIQYIFMIKDNPSGQIRLSINQDYAEIDYSISKDARGKGYGCEIIGLAIEQTRLDHPKIKRFIANVKPGNIASGRCFAKNGFTEVLRRFEYIVD